MKKLILHDLPMPIKTPRLVIKPPEPGMGELFHAAKVETLDLLKEWMAWAHEPISLEKDEMTMRQQAAKFMTREDMMLIMFDHSGRMIGTTGFHDMYNPILPVRQIGYWCRASETGKGYVTEAVNALTRYGFDELGLKKICIKIDEENTRSYAVAERLGYELEYAAKWGTTKPDTDEMRISRVYSRFDAEGLPSLKVSW